MKTPVLLKENAWYICYYGYLYNLQGDVVALVDGTGTKVVEYSYDQPKSSSVNNRLVSDREHLRQVSDQCSASEPLKIS